MDGKLPVNLPGGFKAKGNPIGATGVSMHVMAAMQLAETAPGIQISNARLGGIFNMGGAAVANYGGIPEHTRSMHLTKRARRCHLNSFERRSLAGWDGSPLIDRTRSMRSTR